MRHWSIVVVAASLAQCAAANVQVDTKQGHAHGNAPPGGRTAKLRARHHTSARQHRPIMSKSSLDLFDSRIEIGDIQRNPLSISFHLQGKLSAIESMIRSTAVIIGVILTLLIAAVLLLYAIFAMSSEDQDSGAPPQPLGYGPRTYEDLRDIIQGADGTWAMNYKRAAAQQQEALELLFRCGIIPSGEFSHSRVSQEHIDECVWIASHMLRQKPLEEWVQQWPDAQQTFEQSVMDCFTARSHRADVQAPEEVSPWTYHVDSPQTGTGSPPKPSQRIAEDLILRSRDSTGQNLLIMRCREIMAEARREQEARSGVPLMSHDEAIALSQQGDAPISDTYAAPDPAPTRIHLQLYEQQLPQQMPTTSEQMDQVGGYEADYQAGSSAASSTSAFQAVDPERARLEEIAGRINKDNAAQLQK